MFVLMKEHVSQCNSVAHLDFLRVSLETVHHVAQRNTIYFT